VLSPGSTLDAVDFANRGRPQFLQQLEAVIDQFAATEAAETEEPVAAATATAATMAMPDPLGEPAEFAVAAEPRPAPAEGAGRAAAAASASAQQLTEVMNQGMAFLSGLMQMATGQGLQSEEGAIQVDPETGEVVMKFRLPGFTR
jgi:hypothetical protein